MAQEGQAITWQVHSREHGERSNDWFWGLGLLAVAGGGLAIFFGNSLLAVILILGAASIGTLAARAPREHSARIDKRGISIDGTLHPYESLASFWVEEGEDPKLFVSTTGIIAPHLTVPLLERGRAEAVRGFLKKYLREEEQGPHFGEQIAEFFGL
jgi:hypothetical protein